MLQLGKLPNATAPADLEVKFNQVALDGFSGKDGRKWLNISGRGFQFMVETSEEIKGEDLTVICSASLFRGQIRPSKLITVEYQGKVVYPQLSKAS